MSDHSPALNSIDLCADDKGHSVPSLLSRSLLPDAATLSREVVAIRNAYRQDLLMRLDSRNKDLVKQAVQEVLTLPAQEISALITIARTPREASRKRKQKQSQKKINLPLLIMSTVLLLSFISALLLVQSFQAFCFQFGFIFLFLLGIFLFVALFIFLPVMALASLLNLIFNSPHYHYSPRVFVNLAICIDRVQDANFLPVALRLLHSSQTFVNKYVIRNFSELDGACFNTAARLLRTQTHEQIRAFGIQQQAFHCFLTLESARKKPHAATRVLDYLTEFGTQSAIRIVSRLTQGERTGDWVTEPSLFAAYPNKDVQRAAQTCLEALRARAHRNSQPDILLRASSVPSATQETLLRPASTCASNDTPANLLRPASEMQTETTASGKLIGESSNNELETENLTQNLR